METNQSSPSQLRGDAAPFKPQGQPSYPPPNMGFKPGPGPQQHPHYNQSYEQNASKAFVSRSAGRGRGGFHVNAPSYDGGPNYHSGHQHSSSYYDPPMMDHRYNPNSEQMMAPQQMNRQHQQQQHPNMGNYGGNGNMSQHPRQAVQPRGAPPQAGAYGGVNSGMPPPPPQSHTGGAAANLRQNPYPPPQQQQQPPNSGGYGPPPHPAYPMGVIPAPGTQQYRNTSHPQTPVPPPPTAHTQQQQQQQQPMMSMQQSQPPGNYGQQSPPPQQQMQRQQSPQPPATTPSYMLGSDPVPKVIMVTGYSRTGKTTVAKELAKERGYEYISLAPGKVKDVARKEDAGDEEEEEEDEEYHTLQDRFAPLSELLSRKGAIKGIVIDDALIYNKFEPYYVVFMLESAGLHLDYLVIITTELESLVQRNVQFDSNKKMKAHPESFEFGALLETHNAAANPNGLTPIAVVDGECELDMVVKDSIGQLKEVEARGLAPLELPEVNFIANCTLVSDPQLVDKILAAERAALGLQKLTYGFPYAEPNFLMDYVQFARHSLLFKSYQIVPWIWGDKVSLIGYGDNVYVHLPSYKVVFHLKNVSTPLKEMIIQLRGEVEAHRAAKAGAEGGGGAQAAGAADEPTCLFSLEATMMNGAIYISDMMVLGTDKGSRMLLPNRIARMKARLGKLPATGPVRLLEHYHVREISKCLKANADIARGVLFVNPDGMMAGSYDSRNFIYPSEEVKSVKIRIWGGRVESDGMWVFEALASESGKDTPIVNPDGTNMLVYISNEDVDQYSVNDGDIVECVEEQSNSAATQQQKGGKKAAKAQTITTHFAFQKRCDWQVDPTTLFYQAAFLSKPAWPTNLFIDACMSIHYQAPVPSKAAA